MIFPIRKLKFYEFSVLPPPNQNSKNSRLNKIFLILLIEKLMSILSLAGFLLHGVINLILLVIVTIHKSCINVIALSLLLQRNIEGALKAFDVFIENLSGHDKQVFGIYDSNKTFLCNYVLTRYFMNPLF